MSSLNPISVRYTNWRGETAVRTIVPTGTPFWGCNEWHREPQWLLPALDPEKGEARTFALKDCDFTAEVLAARAQPEGWRDVRTDPPPKDGTFFLVTAYQGEWYCDVACFASGEWTTGDVSWAADDLPWSHWIPLPAPPAPPPPVEREVVVTGGWNVRGDGFFAGPETNDGTETHRLTLRWTEPPGATRGAVTGEWERIGGENG